VISTEEFRMNAPKPRASKFRCLKTIRRFPVITMVRW